jgi:hypothetical protein
MNTKDDTWVIEYSFYHEAFGVLQLQDYIRKARDNYIKQRLHPYVILGAYTTRDEADSECAILQKHRNENLLSVDHRLKEFQVAVDGLKTQL